MSSQGISVGAIHQADPLVRLTLTAPIARAPRLITVNQASLLAEAQSNLSELIAGMAGKQGRGRNVGRADAAPVDEDVEQPFTDGQRRNVYKIATLLADGKTDWKSAYALMRSYFPSAQEQAAVLAELRRDVRLSAEIRTEIARTLAMLESTLADPAQKARKLESTKRLIFGKRDEMSFQKFRKLYRLLFSAGAAPHTTYRELIEAFGFSKRGSVLELLERTAIADIGGDLRDQLADEFQPIRALLLQLRLLRCADALLLSCVNAQQTSVLGNADPAPRDSADRALISLLLASLDDDHEANEVLQCCIEQAKRSGDPAYVRDWSRRVLRGLNSVPVELYCDLAYRDTLLKHLQETLAEQLRTLPDSGVSRTGSHYV